MPSQIDPHPSIHGPTRHPLRVASIALRRAYRTARPLAFARFAGGRQRRTECRDAHPKAHVAASVVPAVRIVRSSRRDRIARRAYALRLDVARRRRGSRLPPLMILRATSSNGENRARGQPVPSWYRGIPAHSSVCQRFRPPLRCERRVRRAATNDPERSKTLLR